MRMYIQSAQMLKPLAGEKNNIDHIVTMQWLLGNFGFWHSCGCHLTHGIHPNPDSSKPPTTVTAPPMSVSLAIPEHFLLCGMAHCPAGGALPSGSVVAMRGLYLVCTSVWVDLCVKWLPIRTLHCTKLITVIASIASGFNVWAVQSVLYRIIIHSHIISIVSPRPYDVQTWSYCFVIAKSLLLWGLQVRRHDKCLVSRTSTDMYLCVLTPWKKALWSIKEICFVSSLSTMWHNSDDRGTSAQCKKSTNILTSFAVSKVFKSEKAAGRNVADKHNYFQFKSCSFKSFLNQEACY